jgi:hypothetical protein
VTRDALQDAREQKEGLEEMISVLNRRLDVGEGRERVMKSRVDLLQVMGDGGCVMRDG